MVDAEQAEGYARGDNGGRRQIAGLMALAIGVVAGTIMIVVASVTDEAMAASPTLATIEATKFSVAGTGQASEAFAVCPDNKRALGGGVIQIGSTSPNLAIQASGPLDASGFTSKTQDGDKAKQWYASVLSGGRSPHMFKVFAICE